MGATDRYGAGSHDITASARSGRAVTPSDDNELPFVSKGLWIGTGGDVAVLMVDDEEPVTYPNVADGTLLPFMVRKVMATETTASGIRAVL